MKEPTVMLQVPHRNTNSDVDSDDGSVIQDKGILNTNYLSGMETREGKRVVFKADSNAKRPTETSVTKDTTWVIHITRS